MPDSVVVKSWDELTLAELYDFLKLRTDVFMWEQKADDEEMDGRDAEPSTRHLWISDDRGCAAYLRVLRNEVPEHRDARLVIGRVATRADRRGEGLTRVLMERAIEDAPGAAIGFVGPEDIAVVEAALARRFAIEGGKTRQLRYRLHAGDAGWQLRLDRTDEL